MQCCFACVHQGKVLEDDGYCATVDSAATVVETGGSRVLLIF